MKLAMLILFSSLSLTAQDVVVDIDSDDDSFSYSRIFDDHDNTRLELFGDERNVFHLNKKKESQVFYEDGNYYVYFFTKPIKEKLVDPEEKSERKRKKRLKVKNEFHIKGKHRILHYSSGYQRHVVPEKFVEKNFVVTAENIRDARLNEVKNSKMDSKNLEALENAIKETSFERKARELSYLVNIIKDHQNKGKVIKK